MWHKVSPISFRIPLVRTWETSLYADKKSYKDNLLLDIKLRDFLKKELNDMLVWKTEIFRSEDEITVNIYTAKASLVNGSNGENLDALISKLTKKFKLKFNVNVKEIKTPEIDATIVGALVASQIEKRTPYKRAIKQAISKAMEKGAKGIKILVGGRLNGAEIARKETYKEWNIPTQTIRANIDYCTVRAETVYGTIGVKVWIYKGQVFKKQW